jgi:hypothetical protein
MREQEMRQRVERFFQTRLRSMVLPATLGLCLAVGGCGDGLNTSDDGGPTANDDGASADGQLPPDARFADAKSTSPDLGGAVAMYMAQMTTDASTSLPDSGMVLRYMAQQPRDASPDLNRVVALYMAQLPVPRS